MAVYTPKGLKIRWDVTSVFSLIAKLYPKRRAKDVLRLTEAIDTFPTAMTLVAGIICFFMKVDIIILAVIVALVRVMSYCLIHWNILLPLVPTIGRIYNRAINWFIFPWLIPSVIGICAFSWKAVIAFYIGTFIGWGLETVLVVVKGRKTYEAVGVSFTQSEFAFVMAYRYFAERDGKSLDVMDNADVESEIEFWYESFTDYVQTHPNSSAKSIQGESSAIQALFAIS